MSAPPFSRRAAILGSLSIVIVLSVSAIALAAWTRPVRQAVAAYTDLISAANAQNTGLVRSLCSTRYARLHSLLPAKSGGVAGLPRNIHPNFQAWCSGANVWICPTNRVGPVYQFVQEQNQWRFDGPVGLLRGRGDFIPIDESTIESLPVGSDSP